MKRVSIQMILRKTGDAEFISEISAAELLSKDLDDLIIETSLS
jgi:hypothetical protein